jgi:hypothetical protein
MQKVVRLSCLHAIWCLALPQPHTSKEQSYQYASKVVHTQIEVIAARVIVDLEGEILSELQKLIFGAKGPQAWESYAKLRNVMYERGFQEITATPIVKR